MKVQVPKHYTNHAGRIKPELEQSLFPSTHGCMSKGKKKGRGQMKENSSSVELASSHTQQVNNALAAEVIHSISFTLLLYLLQSDLWRYRRWSLECCVKSFSNTDLGVTSLASLGFSKVLLLFSSDSLKFVTYISAGNFLGQGVFQVSHGTQSTSTLISV